MADKAKHAYGSRKNLEAAIASGVIDAYDVLFLSGEGEAPAVGWMDKNGNPVIAETDLSGIEAELATKVDTTKVAELEKKVDTKVDAPTVQTMINEATVGVIEVVEF